MGKKRRPPHSVSAEDIDRDLAEMRHSPITRPNLSFLGPSKQPPTPNKTSPVAIAGAFTAPAFEAAPEPAITPRTTAPDETSSDVIVVGITSPDDSVPVHSKSRPVHYCATARDGHSPTEHLIYSTMWTLGRPEAPALDTSRLVQMSQPELARRVGITERNLRIAILRLIEKLTLEEVASYTKDSKAPRIYRVFSEDEILRRRRQAGMLWVVRRKGVQFVPAEQAAESLAYARPVVISGYKTTGAFISELDAFPAPISSVFQKHGLAAAPAVAARLWLECRRSIPDASAEEAAALVDAVLADLRAAWPPDQVVERLLAEWPRRLEPSTFKAFRELRNRSQESLRKIEEENRRYWQSIAADEGAGEEERALARRILETL